MGVQMGTNVQRKGLTGDNWNAHKGHNRIKRLCAAASLPACQPAGLSAGRSARYSVYHICVCIFKTCLAQG